jgi:hypothetical protein
MRSPDLAEAAILVRLRPAVVGRVAADAHRERHLVGVRHLRGLVQRRDGGDDLRAARDVAGRDEPLREHAQLREQLDAAPAGGRRERRLPVGREEPDLEPDHLAAIALLDFFGRDLVVHVMLACEPSGVRRSRRRFHA